MVNERRDAYTSIRSEIADFVPAKAVNVLDVGCSNGALGRHLKSLLAERRVFGVEFDAGFAEAAAHSLDGVVHADVSTLDWHAAFGDVTFDCLIFGDVLEHLPDPERCLRSALQRLAPGGCVIVSLPNVRHVSALWSVFVRGSFPRRDRGIFDSTHLRWFTYADARRMLLELGLRVSSESFALRWRDQGGGRLNRLLNRLPPAIQRMPPIREFLAYQICYRAECPAAAGAPGDAPVGRHYAI